MDGDAAWADGAPAWVDLADPAVRARLTPAALAALPGLGDAWALTAGQLVSLLGDVTAAEWETWQTTPPSSLSEAQLTRVSYLLGIYAAFHALYGPDLADSWVHRPNTNPLFGGRAPLDELVSGDISSLADVRALLDARRAHG